MNKTRLTCPVCGRYELLCLGEDVDHPQGDSQIWQCSDCDHVWWELRIAPAPRRVLIPFQSRPGYWLSILNAAPLMSADDLRSYGFDPTSVPDLKRLHSFLCEVTRTDFEDDAANQHETALRAQRRAGYAV